MEFTKERQNLYRARAVIDETTLAQLRDYFKIVWNAKNQPAWSDSPTDGQHLWGGMKSSKSKTKDIEKKLKSGNTSEWDATCLFAALLNSGLTIQKAEKSSIEEIRKLRNSVFHRKHGSLSDTEKNEFFTKIKQAYTNLSWPINNVEKIEFEEITHEKMRKLIAKLESEKREAIKENQENLRQLPPEITNFVGREDSIKEFIEILMKDENFLVITGGPCYGKSSLANKLGYMLYEEHYNYVVWINMRDIPGGTSGPSLEDLALKILQEFQIDTSEMTDHIVNYLVRKFESITASHKKALLIFDNADSLICPKEDQHLKTDVYSELSKIIRSTSRESIRAIFTTRKCRDLDIEQDHKKEIGCLSDGESRIFLSVALRDIKGIENVEELIDQLVEICYGLPYALEIVSKQIKKKQGKVMRNDYITSLKKNPSERINKDSIMYKLFEKSIGELEGNDKELFFLLAVFPSSFSYSYVSKLSNHVNNERDCSIDADMITNLRECSLVNDDSRDDYSEDAIFLVHPFLRDYVKEKCWRDEDKKKYETAYYTLYLNEFFNLAVNSLRKDKYLDNLKEFEIEQQNFNQVMARVTEIGKGHSLGDSLVSKVTSEVLNERRTPDYIAAMLFYMNLINIPQLLKFFEGCETFADDGMKRNIWCCRYDLSLKYFSSAVTDPYKSLELDEYGMSLLTKRELNDKIHAFKDKNSDERLSALDEFDRKVESLENDEMKAYFKHKILKLRGTLLKKGHGKVPSRKEDCKQCYEEALKISRESFGQSWLTFDCYNQLGKMYWSFSERDNALKAFDDANELAESMSVKDNKKFGAFLLDKGRFFIASKDEEMIAKGKDMLHDALKRCQDFSDTKFWCLAMKGLMECDLSNVRVVKDRFLKEAKHDYRMVDLANDAIKRGLYDDEKEHDEADYMASEESKAEYLKKAIKHLENLLDESEIDAHRMQASIKHLFIWNVNVAMKYNHVLTKNERKPYANNALQLLNKHTFLIYDNLKVLKSLSSSNDSIRKEEALKRKHFVVKFAMNMPEAKSKSYLEAKTSELLDEYSDDQEIWSHIASDALLHHPRFYERVTPFLLSQNEPCLDLLKLVSYSFNHRIRICEREIDENTVIKESKEAVHDLQKAISHIEELLKCQPTSDECMDEMNKSLNSWCICMALRTDHILNEYERKEYALKVDTEIEGVDGEKIKKLRSSFRLNDTDLDEKLKKKSLLIKMTKFMRQNGHQEELERRYQCFIRDCYSYPKERFYMIKFIINMKNVHTSKYAEYLNFLPALFQTGSLCSGWDFKFIIDVMEILLSDEDAAATRRQNLDICRKIFGCLRSGTFRFSRYLRRKLEFQFRVIFSLKVGKDLVPFFERKEHARAALKIDDQERVCRKENLEHYREELMKLIR